MSSLIRSRKFWLMVLDIVISTITYFVTAYVAPEVAEQVIWVIGAWQPVIVALIVGIAVEDAAEKGAAQYILTEEVPHNPLKGLFDEPEQTSEVAG